MALDPLKQFVALQESLKSRKAKLEAELALLAEAFGPQVPAAAPEKTPAPSKQRGPGRATAPAKRAKNALSLREAVYTATKDKPLLKHEILEAVGKLGYVFSAKNPTNSLNTFLYTDKAIKKVDGKFGVRG